MPSDYANDLMARVGLDTTEWKKGITDLNAGIKHIETGFQATAALMDDWSNNSEGLKARVESLNDKLAIQKQKLDLLKKAYDEEVAANGAGSKAAEELAKKMYAAKNEIDRTEQSIEKYNKKLEDMSFISDKTAKTLDDFSKKTRTMSMVATGALAAIGAGIVKAGKNADDINTLSKQTGIATDEIQKFQYASQLVDVELNTVVKSLARMTRNMASNSAETKAAWERIGVSTKTASGEMKNTTDIFYETLEALSKIKNETERDQLAMQIFGKSANELAGIVDDGGKSLRELGAEAENLGLVMSQDALDGANEFNDALDKLKAQLTATLGKAFSENADNLTETVEAMSKVIVGLVDAIASAPPWLTTTTLAIVGLAAVTSPLLKTGSMAIKTIKLVRDAYRSKTKATVEDTVAEGAHAASLDKTAESAKKNAGAMKGIGAAAKSAGPYIALVAAALAEAWIVGSYFVNKYEKNTSEKYKKISKISQDHFDKIIGDLQNEKSAREEILESETEKINSFYDNEISKLEDQLKAQKNAIQEERSLADKAHKEKIGQLEKERDLRLEIIDIQSNREIEALQKQIDAIDALEAADETAKKDRQNKEKLEELEAAIRSAKTYAEKVDAEKAYNAFLAEMEEEKVKNAREAQKAELQGQIETIKQERQNKKDQVTAEFSAAKELADSEYEMQKESLDKRAEALDSFIESETERLEEARSRKLAVLQKETQDYVDELQKRIDKLEELREAERKEIEEKEKEALESKNWFEKVYAGGQGLRDWFEKNRIVDIGSWLSEKINGFEYQTSSKHIGTGGKFGSNASGTNFWRGGLTQVNEEGGEILNLPRGTQIIPHDVSMEMARAAGAASVNNSNNTTNTTNHYQYGAQQEVVVLNVDGRNIARVIEPKVSVLMSDTIYRRRRSGGANQRI